MLEVLGAGGSHRFVQVPAVELTDFYVALLDLVAAQGVPGDRAGALRVAIGTPGGVAAAVTAARGRLTLTRADDAGAEEHQADDARTAWGQACRMLQGHP